MESGTKRRGRPREYEPDAALKRARDTFWCNGYAATSLDELAAAMGMNRPSIYAGFGDKRALYHAAVTRYGADSRSALAAELAKPRPLRATLRAVYRGAAEFYRGGEGCSRGCFLVGTAVTEAVRDERVRSEVEATFDAFTELFTERFQRAAEDGELAAAPAPALAEIATAALNNIALRIRTGANGNVIDGLIDAAVNVICGPETASR